jgi:hypothetical protein
MGRNPHYKMMSEAAKEVYGEVGDSSRLSGQNLMKKISSRRAGSNQGLVSLNDNYFS